MKRVKRARVACGVAVLASVQSPGIVAYEASAQPAGDRAAARDSSRSAARATASRGVTGEFEFVYTGPVLRATPSQAITSPMLVRVTLLDNSKPAGAGDSKDASARRYRISFIGSVAGSFDLRPFIERADGQALTDLPELTVNIVSQLPEQHGTDLFMDKHPTYFLQSNYRLLMYGFAGLWVAIPVVVIVRRMLRGRRVTVVEVSAPPPTLAEQLRPLVEAASERSLSISERGRLELLLMSFWRERLGLADLTPAQAIGRIRADATAGKLLTAVERWLHARESGAGASRATDEVAALLAPYRDMKPVVLEPVAEPAALGGR